jgi:hypothetical protein
MDSSVSSRPQLQGVVVNYEDFVLLSRYLEILTHTVDKGEALMAWALFCDRYYTCFQTGFRILDTPHT